MSALAVSCGRWLRNASSRSCACTPITRGTAPSACTNSVSFASAAPPASLGCKPRATGAVSSQGRPLNRSGRACSSPPCAAPASGWPPMNVKRAGSEPAAAMMPRFVLPVSVTTAGWRMFSSRSASSAMLVFTGAAKMTRSASARTMRSSAATSIACSRIAVSSTSLLSTPMTSAFGQSWRAASAMDPPMSPRPTMPILSKIGVSPSGFCRPGWMTGSCCIADFRLQSADSLLDCLQSAIRNLHSALSSV